MIPNPKLHQGFSFLVVLIVVDSYLDTFLGVDPHTSSLSDPFLSGLFGIIFIVMSIFPGLFVVFTTSRKNQNAKAIRTQTELM